MTRLRTWIKSLLARWRGRKLPPAFVVADGERRSDLPEQLDRRTIYLVGNPPKWAVMLCPCRRAHRLDLNLARPGQPRWTVTKSPSGDVSLHPSIDFADDTGRCHFWLRNGQIAWCMPDG